MLRTILIWEVSIRVEVVWSRIDIAIHKERMLRYCDEITCRNHAAVRQPERLQDLSLDRHCDV